MPNTSASSLRQIFLILLIAVLFGILFWNLYFFVPALLGAYTLYVLLRGPLHYITEHWKWSGKAAAALLLVLSFLVILLPVGWVLLLLRGRVTELLHNSDFLLQNTGTIIGNLESKYGVSLLNPENLKSLNDWAFTSLQHLAGATMNGAGLLIATYFILWFMLTEGKKMEQSFFDWMPLRHENVIYVKKRLNDMVWSNALGIPLMGVVQGLAGLLLYWLAGIDDPWLWFAITFVAGMMPIVGVSLAYIPLTLLLLAQGSEGKALLILLYGIIVMGSVDNIARIWLLNKISDTHPLITLFGVIAGLQLFGFIGFVFGPILIALFILLLQIYHKEFNDSTST